MIFELKNISKSFRQGENILPIISDITLSLKAGEIASLVAPSGSGKTTLLQIAGLLDNPDSGQVVIDGTDYSKAGDKERTLARRNKIGFVYQFHHLLPEFSAIENVMMPELIKGHSKAIARDKSAEILSALSLSHRLNHKPSELSGGEQQRVAIARAMVGNPLILLADEPTGNLDPHTAGDVFSMMMEAANSKQMAALIVTHNHELARKTRMIYTIKDGKIEIIFD